MIPLIIGFRYLLIDSVDRKIGQVNSEHLISSDCQAATMWPVCFSLRSVTVTRGLNMPRTYNTAALNVKIEDHLLITSAVNNKWPLFLWRAGKSSGRMWKRGHGRWQASTGLTTATQHQSGDRHPPAGSWLLSAFLSLTVITKSQNQEVCFFAWMCLAVYSVSS